MTPAHLAAAAVAAVLLWRGGWPGARPLLLPAGVLGVLLLSLTIDRVRARR